MFLKAVNGMSFSFGKVIFLGLFIASFGLAVGLPAQDKSKADNSKQAKPAKEGEAPGISDKERKRRQESLKIELSGAYKKWLDEDVGYIITDEERSVFKRLANDEEREQFIEQFWMRRNPDPESTANDYKEEHYRRIAYANQHFASGIPDRKSVV